MSEDEQVLARITGEVDALLSIIINMAPDFFFLVNDNRGGCVTANFKLYESRVQTLHVIFLRSRIATCDDCLDLGLPTCLPLPGHDWLQTNHSNASLNS